MNQFTMFVTNVLEAEVVPNDGIGTTSLSPYWAPLKEVVIGGLATAIVFALLYKFAWPAIAKAMSDRTARIQADLDQSAAARVQAEADAAEIRTSLGDVDGERSRLFADADVQAESVLVEGRARLEAEIAELEVKAESDLASAAGRGVDDLRADIARYASRAIESGVVASLDEATHQELIEGFIARVGASGGAS
ncbi:MAG: hypothetical protein ACE37B_08145 [Ilumatobacter sp.]|uniref:F0F1 ATP synthase subunit B family protein n=1 Tax=Ilumatobacter sp. TaxID=1967498 RepID=UPI00391D55F3